MVKTFSASDASVLYFGLKLMNAVEKEPLRAVDPRVLPLECLRVRIASRGQINHGGYENTRGVWLDIANFDLLIVFRTLFRMRFLISIEVVFAHISLSQLIMSIQNFFTQQLNSKTYGLNTIN